MLCKTSVKGEKADAIVYLQLLLPYRKTVGIFTAMWNDYRIFHVNSVGKFNCMSLKLCLEEVDYFSQFTLI